MRVVSFLLFVSIFFPLQLLAQTAVSGGKPAAIEPILSWIDAENGQIIFTNQEIVRYDWEKQIIELTPECATMLMALPVVQRREFAVKDAEGVIYRGRFYRSATTDGEGYDGTTILIDQGPLKKLPASPFFTIQGGYPNGGGTHDKDRFAPRIHDALAKIGTLTTIADTELPVRRLWSGHTWVGGEQVLKASAVLFPDTFRVGKTAYLHMLLYKGQHPDFDFDELLISANSTGDDGRFTSKQAILTIHAPLLDNGIYVCKFRPWEGKSAPAIDEKNVPPVKVKGIIPSYPKDALNEGHEGDVIAAIDVDAQGKVKQVNIVVGSGSSYLDKSVLKAISKWTFSPALQGGKSVDSTLKMLFSFKDRVLTVKDLPTDPVAVIANPGMLEITFTITAFKHDGKTLGEIASWSLPPRNIELLAETAKIPGVKK